LGGSKQNEKKDNSIQFRVLLCFLSAPSIFKFIQIGWCNEMKEQESWVDAEQVAAHLGIKKHSVYRWIEDKGLPAHRVGRLFRFKLSEVDEWVRQGASKEEPKNDAN